MKKSKIIIPALAMLVMSTAATVTGTVAWFTMNTTASAEGMVVSAKTNGSLIVKEIDFSDPVLPGASDKATKVIFGNTTHAFYPSTHDLTAAPATGLKRVHDGSKINFETGTAMNATALAALTYDPVVATEQADYYFDYGIYIAGDGLAMNSQNLRFAITSTTNVNLNKALSIDFYGKLISTAALPTVTDTYIGTLNLAGKKNDRDSNTGAIAGTVSTVTYVDLPAAVNIPKVGDGAYAVLMRAYFDGELIETPVEGNFCASYTSAGSSGTVSGTENYYFYSDSNGSSIVDAKVGDQLSGLYVVADNCTKTYARSIAVGNFSSEQLDVSITASTVS